ncbi:hypothetical protein MH117_16590 [Paenibacillus sp. ACRRX]|uniref:hypothetical protein n=1 Tax=Paenibacillus sp. ACRRX TaxID=2918206 RepID=UPI001EF49F95|nr:hypothetical protein [Paenibacillus sp. ACRRX]MCG7409037.1 hypothetical protein [Paenibacillus sp. ACRRX]
MGANRAVGALDAWMEHKLSGTAGAQIGTILNLEAGSADVELEGESGAIRYQLPMLELSSDVMLENGNRVLVVFTEPHSGGGIIVGKVAAG